MSLTTLAAWKTWAGVTDSSLDSLVNALIPQVDAAIKNFCKRDLESASYTEFYSGNGRADLLLNQCPVTAVASVYLDPSGYYGDGSSAFAASTLLTAGSDYALVRDTGSVSTSGRLRRIGAVPNPGLVGGLYYPSGLRQGTLVGWDRGAIWPPGDGNIKVAYTAGYTSPPLDLTLAANELISQVKGMRKTGWPTTTEGLGEYSYSLGLLIEKAMQLGTVRSLLSQYRMQTI